jgi:Coenzyme PQQ synthesis protein D (PqqD)
MSDTSQPPKVDDQTLISRNASLLVAPVHDQTIMTDIRGGRCYGLDDIGGDIWKRLETPCRFADLVRALATDYDADPAVIAHDVQALLVEMAANRVVTLA